MRLVVTETGYIKADTSGDISRRRWCFLRSCIYGLGSTTYSLSNHQIGLVSNSDRAL
jgi:hypothetical protein